MPASFARDFREWLEADGLGGFASGTVCGIRTRRYHALLLTATQPPGGRMVLVNGLEAWVESADGAQALSAQRYVPDVIHPDGAMRIEAFESEPWPHWIFRLPDGTRIEQAIVARHGAASVLLSWKRLEGRGRARLGVRLLLSGRDYHALHRENPAFQFDASRSAERVSWQPYAGVPGVVAWSNGRYAHQPVWYRNFLYQEEQARGLDHVEDLASPGVFSWDLAEGEAWLLLEPSTQESRNRAGETPAAAVMGFRQAELTRRRNFASSLERAADAYLVHRGTGKTIVAGYPWFTDWGRDTFIAIRGLCLATGRLDEAAAILREWAAHVSQGMLPNCFPDAGDTKEFNSVDASLWYIIAVEELFQASKRHHRPVALRERKRFREAIHAILIGYADGTRFGIRADPDDGLLAAGEPGLQLTWMDAKIGEWVVTPRIGKPVEVQALWLNALWIAAAVSTRWNTFFVRGRDSFRSRFWNAARGCLYDVIDVDHRPGVVDATFRPNQIFAVGGLPLTLLDRQQARQVVDEVEATLLASSGLRSLAPSEPGYAPHYTGGVRERDAAYHQGTVWPWLMGPFVEAWVRVRGETAEAKAQARERFLIPFLRQTERAGLGHIAEITDAEPPWTPRGCPFQAWSLGEALRVSRWLAETEQAPVRRQPSAPRHGPIRWGASPSSGSWTARR